MKKYQEIFDSKNIDVIESIFQLFWDENSLENEEYYSHIGLDKKQETRMPALVQIYFSTKWYSDALNDYRTKQAALLTFQLTTKNNCKITLEELGWPDGTPQDLLSFEPITSEYFWEGLFDSLIQQMKEEGLAVVNESGQIVSRGEKSKVDIRAEMFREIKEKNKNYTQSEVAEEATYLEFENIKETVKSKNPSLEGAELDNRARVEFRGKWGKQAFADYDVRNANKKHKWEWEQRSKKR